MEEWIATDRGQIFYPREIVGIQVGFAGRCNIKSTYVPFTRTICRMYDRVHSISMRARVCIKVCRGTYFKYFTFALWSLTSLNAWVLQAPNAIFSSFLASKCFEKPNRTACLPFLAA